METKARIRQRMLALRDAMQIQERKGKSAKIMARVTETLWYKEADILLTYISYRSEVDTESLIQNAFAEGKKVYCPRVEGEGMNFYEILSSEELEEGYRGIKEPQGRDERRFQLDKSQGKKCLMILPGSAFDEEGNRIGYGKGYYDRYLEKSSGYQERSNGSRERSSGRCQGKNDSGCEKSNGSQYPKSGNKGYPFIKTIGVCFACQLLREIPADIHDKRVDMVITETECVEMR